MLLKDPYTSNTIFDTILTSKFEGENFHRWKYVHSYGIQKTPQMVPEI